MIKLKDILLEHPDDFVDKDAGDIIKLLRRKQKYDQFDGRGATESINEAPEQDLSRDLNKVSDLVIKIANKYKKKADVDGMVRSWMLGLHSRLKKSGVKI